MVQSKGSWFVSWGRGGDHGLVNNLVIIGGLLGLALFVLSQCLLIICRAVIAFEGESSLQSNGSGIIHRL